jgi:hypothetical protein
VVALKIHNPKFMKCDICEAPLRRPLPEGFSYTTHTVGAIQVAIPHRPECPLAFKSRAPKYDFDEEFDGGAE